MDPSLLATLALLIGLELILGIDNLLVISLVTERLPAEKQAFARTLGLSLAVLMRLAMLAGASFLVSLTQPVLHVCDARLSWRDLILLAGGAFLIWKAVKELHHAVESSGDSTPGGRKVSSFAAAIATILALDVVFSIDSVITAVGLTDVYWVMATAVILSIAAMIFYAGPVIGFIRRNPSLKVLALSFLVCIGVTLCLEAFHTHVPKQYLYLPMGYALLVDFLQIRQSRNLQKSPPHPAAPPK